MIWACPSKNRMTFSFSTGSLLIISFSGRREAPIIRGMSACIRSVTGSGIDARMFLLSITATPNVSTKKYPQTFSGCGLKGAVDVRIAKAIPDNHNMGVRLQQHCLEFLLVSSQHSKRTYSRCLVPTHHEQSVTMRFREPIVGAMQLINGLVILAFDEVRILRHRLTQREARTGGLLYEFHVRQVRPVPSLRPPRPGIKCF